MKQNSKTYDIIRYIVLGAAVVVFLVAAGMLIHIFMEYKKADREQQQIDYARHQRIGEGQLGAGERRRHEEEGYSEEAEPDHDPGV